MIAVVFREGVAWLRAFSLYVVFSELQTKNHSQLLTACVMRLMKPSKHVPWIHLVIMAFSQKTLLCWVFGATHELNY